MKTRLLFLISFAILGIFVFLSCSKNEDDKTGVKKDLSNQYSNGQAPGNFANGQNNNNFVNGNNQNNFINDDCVVGDWIVPKSSWSNCPQGYHLKLTFSAGGLGMAYHLDEYLCFNDAVKQFNWQLRRDSLYIVYDDESTSVSRFSCPADQMLIYWNGNNPKMLIKQ